MSFHVPEDRRLTFNHPLIAEKWRTWGSDSSFGNNGAFLTGALHSGWELFILASDGDDWEHVSVHACRHLERRDRSSKDSRTPSWGDMMLVKKLFWDPEDVVMQIAPRESEYVNCHPHTLHWWRSISQPIPTPPSHLVGPR